MAHTITTAQVFLTSEAAHAFAAPYRKPRVAGQSVRILDKKVVGLGASVPVFMVVVTQDVVEPVAVPEPVVSPV